MTNARNPRSSRMRLKTGWASLALVLACGVEAIKWRFVMFGAVILVTASLPPLATAQLSISPYNITIMGEDVLTMGHATPLYARGTGENNPAHRLVQLGGIVEARDYARGLSLLIIDATTHAYIMHSYYDTWYYPADSDLLADALSDMTSNQIGVLTSADAFEANITPRLRQQARRLGLVRLATQPATSDPATWRHPYVAIFHGSPAPTRDRQAVEIVQPNTPTAPYAVLATWLIGDGFVGQSLPKGNPDPPCFNATRRFVDCGNGTVTDTVTGLIYLKNANCLGQQDWPTANQRAANLSAGDCGLSDGSRPGDWRLATEEEWRGILAPACSDGPKIVGNGTDSSTSCYTAIPWASGLVSSDYWTSTGLGNGTAFARYVSLIHGSFNGSDKSTNYYVWPVRGGP